MKQRRNVKSRNYGSKDTDFRTMIGRKTEKRNTLHFWMNFKGKCILSGDEEMGSVKVVNYKFPSFYKPQRPKIDDPRKKKPKVSNSTGEM